MQYLVLQGLKSECIAFLKDVAPLLHICLHITPLLTKSATTRIIMHALLLNDITESNIHIPSKTMHGCDAVLS